MSSTNCDPETRSDSGEDSDEGTLLPHQYAPWDYCEKPSSNNNVLRNIITAPDLFTAENRNDRNIYHVIIKAIKFYPENITVKQKGRTLTFECKQAERCVDGCWMSSVVVRRIVIPDTVNLRFLETRISNDYTLSILGVIIPKPRRDAPITMSVRPVRQPQQNPRNVVRKPRMYDVQTSQRLMEAAYKSMNAPGYSYWSLYPDNYVDTLSHLQMQYGYHKPTPQGRPQGHRQGKRPGQSQGHIRGYPQGRSQGHPQEHSQACSQGNPQDWSQGYPQGRSQNYPQEYYEEYAQDDSQGHPEDHIQGYPQDDSQDYPQEHSEEYPQDHSQGYPQGYSRDHPQSQPQGYPQEYSQVYPQSHSQGYAQVYSKGYPQGRSQGYPQNHSQGYPQGRSQGYPQGHSQGYPQDDSQGYPQGQSQGYPQGQSQGYPQGRSQVRPPSQQRMVPIVTGEPPVMRSEHNMDPPRGNSPEESYEILSAPQSEDDDVETDCCSKNCSSD